MASVYHKLERTKEFIRYFIETYEPICCLCGGKIRWEPFYPRIEGIERDIYTIHHLDHDRANNLPNNKRISHRECHRRHHRLEQICFESHRKFEYIAFYQEGKKLKKIRYSIIKR